jgi:hypothetical protein
MKDSVALPDLRMVETDSLIPHEDFDPRRVDKLCDRIWKAGIFKHPPIVTTIPDTDPEQYVVLDGANRSLACARMGIPHMVVQHVHYGDPGVELDTWYHVVCNMPEAALKEALSNIDGLGLKACSLEEARDALSVDEAGAYIIMQDGVHLVTKSRYDPLHIPTLRKIVETYKGTADIYRASNDYWEKQAPYYPCMIALVVFPNLTPGDIMCAVRQDEKIPSGISRHIIPNRALNINIPLHVLASNRSLEEKRRWLHEWFMEKMADNAIRFYTESTFAFDE